MKNKNKLYCRYVLIAAATWLFAGKVFGLLVKWVGEGFFSMESCAVNDVCMWILLVAFSVLIVLHQRKATKEVYKDFRRNVWALIFTLFYVHACISQREWFTPFTHPSWFAYADVLMVWLVIWFFMPWVMYKASESKNNKKEMTKDETNITQEQIQSKLMGDEECPEDLLDRRKEAAAICEYIFDESNDFKTTLAVSITGSWGAGKTVLMNYLKECLDGRNIKHFDYSPWQRSQKDVALDFLNHLKIILDDDNDELNGLKAYIRSIKVSNVTGWFNLGVHAVTHLLTGGEKTTTDLLGEARNDMMALDKPVVAFIDDVDRISRYDFLDVMRLIRATASFPKLIYIVAYDNDRALKLLGKKYGEGYLSKIFNVNHPLSGIDNDQLQQLALDHFKAYGISNENDSPFASLDLTEYLPTIRELKLYSNQLNKDYLAQAAMRDKTYFDFDFYAKLELLKHTDLLAYMMLKNEPTAYLNVNDADWNDVYCYTTKEGLNFQNKATEQLLIQMFDNMDVSPKIFSCPGGLQIMFMNDLDDSYVSKQEFEKAVQDGNLLECVMQWIEQNKQGIMFCLSQNLHLPTETLVQAFELLIENRPSDISRLKDLQYYELTDNNSLDGFSRLDEVGNPYKYVEEKHAFYLYLNRSLSEGDKTELQEIENLKKYAAKTEKPREFLAIVSGMMRQSTENGDVPESWQYDLAAQLYNILASKVKDDDVKNQYFVVEALHYLPFYNATSQLLYPYLKQNPGLWLRLTLNVDSDFRNPEIVTLNTKVMHSMFDTYRDYQEIMTNLMQGYEEDSNEHGIIKEHLLLTERTSKITSLNVTDFEMDKYPAMKGIRYQEKTSSVFVSKYYEDTKEMMQKGGCPFFNNESSKPKLFEGE